MIAFDTNVLFSAVVATAPRHGRARGLLASFAEDRDVVIAELALVELYLLLRNPAVVARPLPAPAAAAVCQGLRRHPRWQVVESASVMDEVWGYAANDGFARRRIVDARLALTLRRCGVTELLTGNVRDFEGFGFASVRDPLGERA